MGSFPGVLRRLSCRFFRFRRATAGISPSFLAGSSLSFPGGMRLGRMAENHSDRDREDGVRLGGVLHEPDTVIRTFSLGRLELTHGCSRERVIAATPLDRARELLRHSLCTCRLIYGKVNAAAVDGRGWEHAADQSRPRLRRRGPLGLGAGSSLPARGDLVLPGGAAALGPRCTAGALCGRARSRSRPFRPRPAASPNAGAHKVPW